jgi:hypothetical protein
MSIREDFFAKKAKGSLWDVAVSIKRGNHLPLDADSIFESYAALETYAADVLAYPGQVVAVVNEDSTGIYYLDQNLAIQPVGVIPSGDSKSIEVTANGVISLLGAKDAPNGTLPMIGDDGKLTWKTLEDIGAGDRNDNTTYEITALEKGQEGAEETYGIQIQVKENGIASGEPIVIDFDVYTKSEADTLLEALDTRIETLEQKEDKDTTYSVKADEKILKLEGTEFSTVASLNYVAATETSEAKIQLLGIDGALVSEIDATPFVKDGMLEDVEYDAAFNTLTFTWNTVAGSKIDSVILSDIIEPYTAGNGLNLSGNEFNVNLAASSEGFLTVDANGLKLSGVQDAINTAKEEAATDATGKANQALADAKADAALIYATKEYVSTIPDNYTETNVISYINKKAEETLAATQGDSSETVASVKQQLDNYKSENDTKVNANTTSITTINEKLTTIESGANANKIEVVKVNGTALEIVDKAVDVIVPGALIDLDGWTALDERITSIKNQADKGVEDAGKAQAAANNNAGEIAKHETRISNLENANSQHNSEYAALKNIVDGHTTAIAGKAEQTALDGALSRIGANESAINTINTTTIPALNTEISKKANSVDVYTKTEVEGLISTAKEEVAYDDTEVRGLITAESERATKAEEDLDKRLEEVETFFAVVETPDETIDTLAEIVKYVEEDKSGAAGMAASIKQNADAIAVINNTETGILTTAKKYADSKFAEIKVATTTNPGLVGFDNTTIKMNESEQLYVASVSTDILTNGKDVLILNGGTAKA